MEQWKPIKGYENEFEVSNTGKVRSLDRFIRQKNRYGGETVRSIKGKEYQQIDNGNGYLYVTLQTQKGRKNKYVHRLVAESFIPNVGNHKYVNHIDYNKKNNCVENLEWCTQKDNVRHSSCRMRHLRTVNKNPVTGEKRISKKGDKYRFECHHLKIDKLFRTLDEAVMYRNEVFNEIGYSE